MNLIRRLRRALTDRGTITFCESCGQVCDGRCRTEAQLERAHTAAQQLPRI